MSGSAYSVSASLNIRGNYQSVMRQLGSGLTALDNQIMATERNVVRLAGLFPRLARIINSTARASSASMSTLQASITSASGSMSGFSRSVAGANRSMTSAATRLNNQTTALNVVTRAAQQATAAMRALSQVPPPPRIPPPGRGGGGGGGGQGGGGGGRNRRLTDPSATEVYAAGRSAFHGGMEILRAGGAEQDAMTMLRAQAFSAPDLARVRDALPGLNAAVPGTSRVDALKAFQEAQNAVGGDINAALQIAPMLLRAGRLAATTTGRPMEQAVRPLTRSLAIRGSFTNSDTGQLDVATATSDLQELENMLIGFGGAVDPRELEGFFRRGGIAAKRMSMRSVVGPMGSLMQEVGGDAAGTQATAFNDQVVSGIISKERRGMWREQGLEVGSSPEARATARTQEEAVIQRLVAEGKLTPQEANDARTRGATNPVGDRLRVIGRGLATVRPDLWMQEHFAPNQRARGVTTEDAMIDNWDAMSQRATGRRFGMSMLQTREVQTDIQNVDRTRRMRAQGGDPTGLILNEGFTNSLANVTQGFNSLLTALGTSPEVVPMLNQIAAGIRDLATAAREDTTTLTAIIGSIRVFLTDLRGMATGTSEFAQTTIREWEGVKAAFSGLMASSAVTDTINEFNRLKEIFLSLIPSMASLREKFASFLNFGQWLLEKKDAARDFLDGGSAPGTNAVPTMPGAPGTGLSFPGIPGGGGGGIRPLVPGSGMRLGSFQPMAPGGQDTVVHTMVNLDGRTLTDIITRHQGRAASAPVQGSDRYDLRRGGMVTESVTA